jgi:CubicO group peptidase (beta-lactamase class C family)
MKRIFIAAALLLCTTAAMSQGLNDRLYNSLSDFPDLRPMESKVDSFMRFWDIRGASLSIVRNDSLVYSKGFGWADKEKGLPMQPGNLLRLASVSKLITAIGIMVLQENGRLNLQSPVFGPYGILKGYDGYITDDNYYLITVEHLLRHQGGFTKRFGDPMSSTRSVMSRYGLRTPPDAETLTHCLLKEPLDYEPGTSQSYSHFGYLLLSMIIEQVSGTDYETFIRRNVMEKAGCQDFHIGGIYEKDRLPGEVKYYMHKEAEPVSEFNGSGNMVTRCYGGNDITALSGAGAWVGSTPELARLVSSIDAKMLVPDILTPFSVFQMTQYWDEDTFGLGWIDTNKDGEWTRTGSFSGTNAMIKYYPDGQCWIMVTNTGTWKGTLLAKDISALFRSLRSRYGKNLPKQDLFQ